MKIATEGPFEVVAPGPPKISAASALCLFTFFWCHLFWKLKQIHLTMFRAKPPKDGNKCDRPFRHTCYLHWCSFNSQNYYKLHQATYFQAKFAVQDWRELGRILASKNLHKWNNSDSWWEIQRSKAKVNVIMSLGLLSPVGFSFVQIKCSLFWYPCTPR